MLKLLGLLPFVLHLFVGFACYLNVPCDTSSTRVNALTDFELEFLAQKVLRIWGPGLLSFCQKALDQSVTQSVLEKNVFYTRELFRMAASYDLRYSGFIHSVVVILSLRLFLDQTKRKYSYVYFIGAFIITLIRHIASKETEYVLPLITAYLFHIPCLLSEDYFHHSKINLQPI